LRDYAEQCHVSLAPQLHQGLRAADTAVAEWGPASAEGREAREARAMLAARLRVLDTMLLPAAGTPARARLTGRAWDWGPLPSEDLSAFTVAIAGGDASLPPYAFTTHHLLAAQELAAADGDNGPGAAAAAWFACGMLDALWASYFASGNTAAVDRVVAAAGSGLACAARQKGSLHSSALLAVPRRGHACVRACVRSGCTPRRHAPQLLASGMHASFVLYVCVRWCVRACAGGGGWGQMYAYACVRV